MDVFSRARFAGLAASALAVAPAALRAQTPAPAPVRAAITPIYYDAVPILYAQKTGMFSKAGIDLSLQRLTTGGAITAAVAGGSLDLGKSSFTPIVAAFARGIPLTVIAPGAIYDAHSPNGAVCVLKDSTAHAAKDMVGKTIALNNLNDPTRVAIEAWLESGGVTPSTVKFVEVPNAAMMPALDEKRIDGIMLTSPYMDQALGTGKVRALAPVMSWVAPRFLFSAYFARKEWALRNRDLAKRFADVMVASAAYTNAHHKALTSVIAGLEGVPASAIEHMTWPTGGTSLKVREMQPVIDIAFKHGLIPKRFDASEMLFS